MHQRIPAIDYMRLVLAAFVVIGHSGLGQQTLGIPGLMIGNAVIRSAVPLFAMTAGFFLFRVHQQGRAGLWMRRMLALYLIWSAFYFVFMHHWDRSFGINLWELVLGFKHLWFLEGLVIGAIILVWAFDRGTGHLIRVAAICGLVGLVLQYVQMGRLLHVPLEMFRNGPFFLLPFMTMGFLVAMKRERPEALSFQIPDRPVLLRIALAGLVIGIAENVLCIAVTGPYPLLEFPIGTYLLVPAVFGLVLGTRAPATDLPLGLMASAIYVMHIMFLHMAGVLGHNHPLLPALAGFFIPAFCILALKRMRRGQRLVGQIF